MFFYGAAYQKSHSAVFMLPQKDVPSAVVRTVHICDVGITQLDWKRHDPRSRPVAAKVLSS